MVDIFPKLVLSQISDPPKMDNLGTLLFVLFSLLTAIYPTLFVSIKEERSPLMNNASVCLLMLAGERLNESLSVGVGGFINKGGRGHSIP